MESKGSPALKNVEMTSGCIRTSNDASGDDSETLPTTDCGCSSINRACDEFLKMRVELEVTKEMWKQEKEEQHKSLRAAQEKAILVVRRRKAKVRSRPSATLF